MGSTFTCEVAVQALRVEVVTALAQSNSCIMLGVDHSFEAKVSHDELNFVKLPVIGLLIAVSLARRRFWLVFSLFKRILIILRHLEWGLVCFRKSLGCQSEILQSLLLVSKRLPVAVIQKLCRRRVTQLHERFLPKLFNFASFLTSSTGYLKLRCLNHLFFLINLHLGAFLIRGCSFSLLLNEVLLFVFKFVHHSSLFLLHGSFFGILAVLA